MSTYLKNIFIFYENGTDIENKSYQDNIIFYDKIPINKKNNWDIKLKSIFCPRLIGT